MIAINTDAQDLLYTNAAHKVLIGKELTRGLGAGSIPQMGEEAERENEHDIRQKLQNSDKNVMDTPSEMPRQLKKKDQYVEIEKEEIIQEVKNFLVIKI